MSSMKDLFAATLDVLGPAVKPAGQCSRAGCAEPAKVGAAVQLPPLARVHGQAR